ncbi:hypothetical protein CDL15_Pgr028132 [Punica granatum]|uniref:Uncharacterized protein n=1 Tax=Punica granatum TaxID=22663 RepID=A0A218WW89_PUNGR|nr:hypothetical protein CDL15_Pgr028132 [Punica granatum]
MHAELWSVREERDRLRCELVDSRAEVADYKELQTELTRARARVTHLDREMACLSVQLDRVIITGIAPVSDSSTSQNGRRRSSRHLRGSQSLGSGPFSTASNARSAASDSRRHAPGVLGRPSYASPAPTSLGAPLARASQTPSASNDQARIMALEGMVNQMATSMAELLALLKGSNRTSSSSTPPPGPGPTANPTPWALPTQAPENMEAPIPPTLHTGNHLHHLAAYYGKLNRGIPVPPLSRFFPGPSHTIGGTLDGASSDSDDTPATPSAVCAVTEEIPSGIHIRVAHENEELDNWTSVPRYSAVIADV